MFYSETHEKILLIYVLGMAGGR